MSLILLEITMQAAASRDAIGPDLSDAPENRSEESPEMSDQRSDGFQMPGTKSQTSPGAWGESARTTECGAMRESLVGDKESN